MSMLRPIIEEEFADVVLSERGKNGWPFERRNRKRTEDWWLIMSIRTAMRTLHLGRYRNPAVRRAIIEAREAVDKAERLIRRDYWERKDAYTDEHDSSAL